MTDSSTGGFLASASPPPDEDALLDNLLQALVVGVVGLPGVMVRPRWQESPPPMPDANVSWAAIGVVDEDPEFNISLMHAASAAGFPNGLSTSYDNDIVSVLATFYGPSARGLAKRLRTGLMIPQNRELLYATGLQLMEIPGKTLFVPEIVNQITLRRADITLRFRRRTTLNWAILNIVQMVGSIVSDAGPGTVLLTPHSLNPLKE